MSSIPALLGRAEGALNLSQGRVGGGLREQMLDSFTRLVGSGPSPMLNEGGHSWTSVPRVRTPLNPWLVAFCVGYR